MNRIFIILGLTLLTLTLSYCSEDPVENPDPSNLSVTIISVDEETLTVELQATATNAVRYDLHLNDSDTPEQSNTEGFFTFTVEDYGIFTASVRAYGTSGRYLSIDKSIEIKDPVVHDVPLDQGYFSPESYDGYTMVWNDEFTGNALNTNDWTYEIGDGCPNNCGWGNNELEYYRSENAWLAGETLIIEAREEAFSGSDYTSAKLITRNKFSFQYGRIDIRALLPKGQGIWPALWMLGNNMSAVGWPKCGEIDIMEMIGGSGRENTCYGTLHWDNMGQYASYGGSTTVSPDDFTEAYHVFSITWDETRIKWYVDNDPYHEMLITDPEMSEFQQEFWLIFNVAVGGNWPGNPDGFTVFPQQMKVDYVRVFQVD